MHQVSPTEPTPSYIQTNTKQGSADNTRRVRINLEIDIWSFATLDEVNPRVHQNMVSRQYTLWRYSARNLVRDGCCSETRPGHDGEFLRVVGWI